jgi:hypothetical protein
MILCFFLDIFYIILLFFFLFFQVKVKVLGKSATISYIRTVGNPESKNVQIFNESRIWNLVQGQWKQVHIHKSRA